MAKKRTSGFSAEEKAAMRERVKELKASKNKADGEADVRAKIAEMSASDRAMAKKIHALVKKNAPNLVPRTWYGMPAYSSDEKVVCFFRPADKFGDRYATFGFNDKANLDNGNMWPTGFALTKVGPAEEKKIGSLVKKAAR